MKKPGERAQRSDPCAVLGCLQPPEVERDRGEDGVTLGISFRSHFARKLKENIEVLQWGAWESGFYTFWTTYGFFLIHGCILEGMIPIGKEILHGLSLAVVVVGSASSSSSHYELWGHFYQHMCQFVYI